MSDPGGFSGGYVPPPGALDEMLGPDDLLRPHWRGFVGMLDDLGPEELRRRQQQALGLIHENGVTHNVYGDPKGLDRPWSLDFVPLLLPAAEWEGIAAGLIQRARLLDRLLADLYGPADSVSSGLLPAELVYGNPGFLRPCHGLQPPAGRWLHLYAADLVRGAAGGVEVLSDRTQAPSGAGYTLENRIVLSRVLAPVFRRCNVLRLAPYFAALRRGLSSLRAGRVVLLTPGPYNETYFEHVYLARYLGYTLVQGNDLTVRDARVYLKTLGGLQPVEVVLRRVDDDFCDPLELNPDSYLGVPGLLEAAREGNVAVANALGSGVLQAPGFLPFLPALCRRWFGEELRLPPVRTWWCGDPASLGVVLDRLPGLVVKTALPASGADPVFGHELSRQELDDLAARIRATPAAFVAQEPAAAAFTPALADEGVRPRRFVMRAYLAAEGDGYAVLPGGLTRVPWSADSRIVSLQKGGRSKDTWILADGPVAETSLLPSASLPVDLTRGGGDLPSRVADDLFWLGRTVQRAEAAARIARAALGRLLDLPEAGAAHAVRALTRSLRGGEPEGPPDLELVAAVLGTQAPRSLRPLTASILRLARVLRDRISADAWRILQAVERDVAAFRVDPYELASGVPELLDRLIPLFAAFAGLSADSMTRGQAWRFLDLGQRIERAAEAARLLRDVLVEAGEDEGPLLEAVLEIADSSLTYRRRYFTRLEVHPLVDLLLADETNPRAAAYQAAEIVRHLEELPSEGLHPGRRPDRQLALQLRTSLQVADIRAAGAASGGRRPDLDALLGATLDLTSRLADALGRLYFSHAEAPRVLQGPGEEPAP